ncbi:hypothetical protein PRUPE_8G015000 [Prunus persica]|uniref:Uncharacterized protein n=1 Tax=Prunus persica TaxID=3760 RepID=A0A251MUP2_PRUPE|nr:hypothetical protein PRUPE_8G015000 [Prunus persica]
MTMQCLIAGCGDTDMEELTNNLNDLPPLSSECCIYKVPKRLRGVNNKAYTPQVVSIGPLHHGRESLKAMEEHKMRYMKDFLERTGVELEVLFKDMMERQAQIRASYAVTVKFDEHELVKIIMVDATFTFEVMLRVSLPSLQRENDRIFGKPGMLRDIIYDMLLLENQVPFFILEYLYFLAHSKNIFDLESGLSIISLTHKLFRNRVYKRPFHEICHKFSRPSTKIHHFVDFLLQCHRPLPSDLPTKKKFKTLNIPNATELHQAGNGILKIPRLRIRGSTEIFFRNLIAYEQCEHCDHYINDYVFFMDRLVDSAKDVELLAKSRVLESKLPDSKATADFINNLDLGPILFSRKFYFTDLCDKLNEHYGEPWHEWKASLKQDYFKSPWASLSIIVAAILVVLTFIQTVCSVMEL